MGSSFGGYPVVSRPGTLVPFPGAAGPVEGRRLALSPHHLERLEVAAQARGEKVGQLLDRLLEEAMDFEEAALDFSLPDLGAPPSSSEGEAVSGEESPVVQALRNAIEKAGDLSLVLAALTAARSFYLRSGDPRMAWVAAEARNASVRLRPALRGLQRALFAAPSEVEAWWRQHGPPRDLDHGGGERTR